jgi:hypothetical protein
VQMFRDWEEMQEPPRKRMTIFALTANVSGKLLTNHAIRIAMPLIIESPYQRSVSIGACVRHHTQQNLIRQSSLAEKIWKGCPSWSKG